MNKMTRRTEQDILNSLEKLVNNTRSGQDPQDSLVKIAKDKGYSIPIVQRMCESYNKSKTIHMLNKTASNDRANSFTLIDANKVIQQLMQGQEKTAGFEASISYDFCDFASNVVHSKPMQKTASLKEIKTIRSTAPRSKDSVLNALMDKEASMRKTYERACSKENQLKIGIENTINDILDDTRADNDTSLQKIAQAIYNKYDTPGGKLMAVVYAKKGKQMPRIEKTAYSTILPKTSPFLNIEKAVKQWGEYQQARLQKEAFLGGIMKNTGASLMGSLGAETLEPITHKISNPENKKEVLDASFKNKLKQLDVMDNFFTVYTKDDFLSKQPLDTVLKAYNNTLQIMPTITTAPNKEAIITALVKKQVAEGNNLEPTELAEYIKMENSLQDTEEKALKNVLLSNQITADRNMSNKQKRDRLENNNNEKPFEDFVRGMSTSIKDLKTKDDKTEKYTETNKDRIRNLSPYIKAQITARHPRTHFNAEGYLEGDPGNANILNNAENYAISLIGNRRRP